MTTTTTRHVIAMLVACTTLAGCQPKFDDEKQSLLEKPELLALVVEPPEAAPGETVRLSFLFADAAGVVADPRAFWLPGGLPIPADLEALATQFSVTQADLLASSVTLTLPPERDYAYNEEGRATLTVALLVARGQDAPFFPADAEEALEDGRARPAVRTLVVSKNDVRNQNPAIQSVTLRRADGTEVALSLVTSADADPVAGRAALAASAPTLASEEEVTLVVGAEDDGPEVMLRPQWIATGGDFQNRRMMEQPWTAPTWEDPAATPTRPGTSDPNLHSVWLVLRDNGDATSLGQAWAETAVRVAAPVETP